MADFLQAYNIVMKIEGLYSNDPNDRGGETYKGVARKKWPNWGGWVLIDQAKKAKGFPASLQGITELQTMVHSFFKEQFWNVHRLSEFTNQSIALEMFDTGVNMGTGTAAVFLQRVLNVLNRNQATYKDIKVDGQIGRETVALVNHHRDPQMVYNALNTLQGAKYISIAEANPSQEKYMYGWLSRVYSPAVANV